MKRRTALLIVDMINDFKFPDSSKILNRGVSIARSIAKLKVRVSTAGYPTVYVNDNFKQWHDSFDSTIEYVQRTAEGKKLLDLLRPEKDDYYILKPERSGFYQTALEVLLRDIAVNEVIVTGITTDMCVLHTVQDAHIRGFDIRVPSDCSATLETKYHRQVLNLLKRTTDADISPSNQLTFPTPK